MSTTQVDTAVLGQILAQLESLQMTQQAMPVKLDNLSVSTPLSPPPVEPKTLPSVNGVNGANGSSSSNTNLSREKSLYPGRVLLTTYPSQHSITPYPLKWGAPTPLLRGPIICSRLPSSLPFRNALGAHSGSYSIYRALSIAMGTLDPNYKPEYGLTEPPVEIRENPAWHDAKKIVSMDPWGHLVPQVFEKEGREGGKGGEGLDIRPSISVTKAHIKLKEIDEAVKRGEIVIDGKIVLGSEPLRREDGSLVEGIDAGVEVNVSKAAVDPIWYLPGVAERFGIAESLLRRALFEDTGGMYPELITRPDINVFLPPIGGLTVYIFGNPAHIHDPSRMITVRVHDECNGSDVFGSDICTCKPYLTYAMEECIRTAQGRHPDQITAARQAASPTNPNPSTPPIEHGDPGVGVVVYFRKEGRALGEVTKYLVYNLRKRTGDSASSYFRSTELVAGVKDMRFQALMPDVLHWLGITRIDNMVSMSDMKYDAIVGSGIEIRKRYDIPGYLIPPDSRVEIDAKIASGYFTKGKRVTQEELKNTVGRAWEEVEH
ncbi:hypothetical protein HHX47_DHR9000012 [Lentinula edodes]|nr:hypothetical protein HHX47_DHR9000012 [Lentinula edodes]